MFIPPFTDLSFTYRKKALRELRIVFCNKCLFGLKKVVDVNVVPYNVILTNNLSARATSSILNFRIRNFLSSVHLGQCLILSDNAVTGLDYMRYVGYRS